VKYGILTPITYDVEIKKTASDENHRPCLPLKPQEKFKNSS
jgi:hypothetical protein